MRGHLQLGSENAYLQHYQRGAGLPVFQGSEFQYGAGLGNVLGSIARWFIPFITPIASRAASKFITTTSDNLSSGKSLRDSAKGALGPSLSEALDATTSSIQNRMQTGHGKRKRKRNSKSKKVASAPAKKRRRVYKKRAPKHKRTKKHRRSKKRTLPIGLAKYNF